MIYRLTRLASSHTRLRTDEVVGEIEFQPEVGSHFQIFAEPLESGDVRVVTTSEVQELWEEGENIRFATLNSLYVLEPITEGEEE